MSLMEKGCAGRSGGKVEMQGKEPCGGLSLLLLLLLLFSFLNLILELHSKIIDLGYLTDFSIRHLTCCGRTSLYLVWYAEPPRRISVKNRIITPFL